MVSGSGWFLDKVIIKEEVDGDSQTSGRPESARKGTKNTSNNNNSNNKKGSSSNDSDTETEEVEEEIEEDEDDESITEENTNNNNEKSAEDKPEPRMWYFLCDNWLESSVGDGCIERELCPSEPPEPEPEKGNLYCTSTLLMHVCMPAYMHE